MSRLRSPEPSSPQPSCSYQQPSPLDIDLTPSMFDGEEENGGKNMKLLRALCENMQATPEEQQQQQQQETNATLPVPDADVRSPSVHHQQQQQEEEEGQPIRRTPPPTPRTVDSEDEFQSPSTAPELLASFRSKCREAERTHKKKRFDLLKKKTRCEKNVKQYEKKVCDYQRLLAEAKKELYDLNKNLKNCESSAEEVKNLLNRINFVQ